MANNSQIYYVKVTVMQREFVRGVKGSGKRWYLPMVLGTVFIILSIQIFLNPATDYGNLAMLFAFTFILAGTVGIVHAVSIRDEDLQLGMTVDGRCNRSAYGYFVGYRTSALYDNASLLYWICNAILICKSYRLVY